MIRYKLVLKEEESIEYNEKVSISSSADVARMAVHVLGLDKDPEEVLTLLTMNTKGTVTGIFEVSRGTINSTLSTPREVFKRALLDNAARIILIHNHPSGDPTPSKDDIYMTDGMVKCGELLKIEVLDHLIVGLGGEWVSLREHGEARF